MRGSSGWWGFSRALRAVALALVLAAGLPLGSLAQTAADPPSGKPPARPAWAADGAVMEGPTPDGTGYLKLIWAKRPPGDTDPNVRVMQERYEFGRLVDADTFVTSAGIFGMLAVEMGTVQRTDRKPRVGMGIDEAGALVMNFRQSRLALLGIGVLLLMLVGLMLGLRAERQRLRRAEEALGFAHTINSLAEQSREAERKRLARELHDGPLQSIAAVRNMLAFEPDEHDAHDERLRLVARELRSLTEMLRSPLLDDMGFAVALQSFGASRFPAVQLHVDVQEGLHVEEPYASALLRIGQEAMGNAVRHGEAREVRVRLVHDTRTMTLTVRDNGRGFSEPLSGIPDLVALARAQHFGLLGMYERVAALGGRFHVDSGPGQGTVLTLSVPLEHGYTSEAQTRVIEPKNGTFGQENREVLTG